MNILDTVIKIFIVMESINVYILYFAPQSQLGNGIGVFNQWFKSQENENNHLFIKYLVNWVAGTKLIFIMLLLVILNFGNEEIKLYTVIAMIISILSYFWRLHPIIKTLDKKDEITPKGYSKALFGMISGFIAMFSIALIMYLFQNNIV